MAKGKKQEDPNKVAQRKAERVAFVQSHPNLAPEVARQRFYVQTRAAELEAAGKDVDRGALREKFQSGGVTREGFYTPGDVNRFNAARDNSNSLADSKKTPAVSTPTTPVAPSATTAPTSVKPTTSSVKTPSTSYQAPQTTTALGQVVNTPAPSGTLAASKNNAGPNVRAGVGTRRVDTSMPTTATGVPQIAGVTWRAPSVLPDAVITAPQHVPTAVKGKNPVKLSGKGGQNLAAWRAQQDKWDREEFAADRLVNTGIVMAAETAGGIAGSLGGPTGSVAGAALAAGLATNLTNRITNWQTGGRYKGDTSLAGAAKVTAISGIVGGATLGIMHTVPKIPGQWTKVQNWANDVRVAAPAPKALEQVTGRAFGGAPGQVIETNLGQIAPRSMAVVGEQPFKPVAETVESKAANKVKDKVVNLVRRGKAKEAVEVAAPKAAPQVLPVEPPAPKFTLEVTRESGLVIPATSRRTTQQVVRDVEARTAEESAAIGKKAIDDVLGKPVAQEPVSLAGSKEAMVVDNVQELTPRQQAARKGWETRKANAKKLAEQNVEVKSPTVGAAKLEPVPNITPEPAPMSVVQGESADRLTQMRNHPAFTSKLPETKPSLSVVSEEAAPAVVAPAKRPPTQRANETSEAYAKRLKAWQTANEGEVFKAPAGFEEARGSVSYQEKTMTRIEGGMSRTNRSRTTAFVEDAGVGSHGFPVQMEGESVWDFNIRSSKWLRENGRATPVVPDNSYLAEGNPPSLAQVKSVAAEGDIPPKPAGLKPNAAYDPETKTWRNRRLDKESGEFVFVKQRTKFATEEERKAAEIARNAAKNERRKAERALAATELKTKAETVAASGGPDAEYGPFMFGGEPIGRSKVTLTPGEVPDWAQQNVSLTTPGLSQAEQTLIDTPPTPELEAYLRELGNAQKMSAGRRVTRGTRQATAADVQEYVRRLKGVRGEEGLTPGIDRVALTTGQANLEKEIEQVLGTDAVTALKNVAMRGNTPPLTQNLNGLQSLAEVKAASTEPLMSRFTPRVELPSASGKLREQAAQFFNAQGKLKGLTGSGRIRTWQRLTQSDWFKKLSVQEPTFANFLIEQNKNLGEAFNAQIADQASRTLPMPKMRQAGWFGDKIAGKAERAAAAKEFETGLVDNGLGAYDLKGEELVTGVKPGNFREGTTVGQRAEAASIEQQAVRQARINARIKAEDQAAFGDIAAYNRGFEQGQVLDPLVDKGVTADYGITDERGFANIDFTQFNIGRRQLNQQYQPVAGSVAQEKADMIESFRQQVVADWRAKKITKDEMNARLYEFRSQLMDQPSTGLPANPFQQEFGTSLPNDYVRELPESYGKVWDPDTWTNEAGDKIEGRWVDRTTAAEKAQKRAVKQSENKLKVEEAWNRRHPAFGDTPWMIDAETRAIAAREAKAQKVVEPIFRNPDKPLEPIKTRWSSEEARRIASVNERAAKIKASGPQGKTAEEIRFELKNPKPKVVEEKTYEDLPYLQNLDPYARALEEARLNAQDAIGEYESDALDWIND